MSSMFEVDAQGFRDQQAGRNPARLVAELIANSFDEDTAKNVEVTIKPVGVDTTWICVADDGKGFRRHSDIYTLFAYSDKVNKPDKRGRFNLGEKQFIASCKKAFVYTGGIVYTFKNGKRTVGKTMVTGTKIEGWMTMTRRQTENLIDRIRRIIPPQGKKLLINGSAYSWHEPVKTFQVTLPTVLATGKNATLSKTRRKCTVELYDVVNGGKGWLYEMGIPVQGIDCPWHVNVLQKIPLSPNRDTVRDSYLDEIYAAVLNEMHEDIPEEKAGNVFVTRGLKNATKEAAQDILTKQYGTDNIYLESGDSRSNESAMEHGAVIGKGILDGDTRKHLQDLGIVEYAAEAFPVDWTMAAPVELTPKMLAFAKVVKAMARDTINRNVNIDFVSAPESSDLATYGRSGGVGTLTFNVAHLHKDFFDGWSPRAIAITIHELAHDKPHEHIAHLSMDYVREIERIAGIVAFKGLDYYVERSHELS